jgi:hypothetical protein
VSLEWGEAILRSPESSLEDGNCGLTALTVVALQAAPVAMEFSERCSETGEINYNFQKDPIYI